MHHVGVHNHFPHCASSAQLHPNQPPGGRVQSSGTRAQSPRQPRWACWRTASSRLCQQWQTCLFAIRGQVDVLGEPYGSESSSALTALSAALRQLNLECMPVLAGTAPSFDAGAWCRGVGSLLASHGVCGCSLSATSGQIWVAVRSCPGARAIMHVCHMHLQTVHAALSLPP